MTGGRQVPAAISILVAEDDEVFREALALVIARRFPNAVLHLAENGRRGVELFKEHRPALVVTDVAMPEMDGIHMAQEIRAMEAETRFIVLTAHYDTEYREEFDKIGCVQYIIKPVEFAKMLDAIERCIAEAVPVRRARPQ